MADTYPKNTIDDDGLKKVWDMAMDRLGLKVDKEAGKGLSTNDFTTTEKNKLEGIESGAEVNTVTSVAGKTGAVTLDKSDVGLENVGNFKAVSTSANQGLTDTEKSNARANIGAGTSNFSGSYNALSDIPSSFPPSAHTHGNLQNGGTLQTTDVAIANGDKLVVTDSSDSAKIARTSLAFDGSTATKCLTQKGTWENFTNNAGTVTGIKMNGSTVGSSGVVDLGTVITSHQDISGKLNKSGDSMSGPLCMNSAKDNYREGIRINAGANGYSTLTIGTESNSTEGISDKSFWIGTNRTNASHARKLYIAHNSSTTSTTLFYAENSSQVSPYLQIGSRLDIKGSTVGTNTYDDTNPKLRFLNRDATRNISLTFTDYDAVQSPASLTLNGNQGGEYFIAPNIKATGKFYGTLQGNADTATKLATARKIALGGDFTGSANFDGSANIVIASNFYYSSINSGNKANYPWHRIACCSEKTGQYTDVDAILDIRHGFNGGGYGRIKISLRTNSTNVGVNISATWLYRYGFSADSIKIACWGVTGQAVYADVFINVSTYARAGVYQVEGSRAWTLVSSSEVNDTTASDPKTSTECWASIEAAGTALHNKAYTSIVSATDGGTVSYANNAGSIPWSGVSDKPTSFTPSSHTHGNIQNGGTLQTNDITIASGDKLVVTDSSDSSKIARTSISFDGSTATKCLTQKGTWETFASTDTLNTVGATNNNIKLYLIGTPVQGPNPISYAQGGCYAEGGKLYSNSKEVVTLSDSQALTGKTYNGYTLGAACEKGVATEIRDGLKGLVASQTVYSYLNSNYAMINKTTLVTGNNTTSYTHTNLKTATAILVTCAWMGYFICMPLLISGSYHYVFDNNGSMYTAVILWDKTAGKVSCTNRNDVSVYAITLLT